MSIASIEQASGVMAHKRFIHSISRAVIWLLHASPCFSKQPWLYLGKKIDEARPIEINGNWNLMKHTSHHCITQQSHCPRNIPSCSAVRSCRPASCCRSFSSALVFESLVLGGLMRARKIHASWMNSNKQEAKTKGKPLQSAVFFAHFTSWTMFLVLRRTLPQATLNWCATLQRSL